MANIKSAKKRVELNIKQNERNSAERSAMRTAIKKFEGEPTAETFKAASSAIDSAKSKGLIHANKAARDKSRLSAKLA
ncbi:MAG: 30S ribosomal protein S20 [Streptococcaceae bacterium]|jgi:small subunit ribosomal protein S20|nr:30S ribosomal protein S20 [Streptococcaceae bacterium]